MNEKKGSYLLVILSVFAVFMLALAAGCTGNGTQTTQVPTASPTVIATTQAPASTTPAAVMTTPPVSTGQKQTIKISGSTTVLPIVQKAADQYMTCLLYTSPSPRDGLLSRMPSS